MKMFIHSQEDIENFKAEIEKRQLAENSELHEQKEILPELTEGC